MLSVVVVRLSIALNRNDDIAVKIYSETKGLADIKQFFGYERSKMKN
jgi:hypothetical protein